MTSEDLLAARARALCEFFRGRFGLRWRTQVRDRFGAPASFASYAGGKTSAPFDWHLPVALTRAETWAISNGFDASVLCYSLPFERNRLRQFDTVANTVSSTILCRCQRDRLSILTYIRDWVQHKTRHKGRHSDVIHPHLLVFSPSDQRIVSPSGGKKYRGITVESLLNAPVLPAPRVETSTGGQPGAGGSLSHSRAATEVPRAGPRLHVSPGSTELVSGRGVCPKCSRNGMGYLGTRRGKDLTSARCRYCRADFVITHDPQLEFSFNVLSEIVPSISDKTSD